MPWVVVEFLPHRGFQDITVLTIPQSWVYNSKDNAYAVYPPDTYSSPIIQRMIRKEQKPFSHWEKLQLKFVTAPFDDMAAAVHLEIEVADSDETDLEAFVDTLQRRKSKRKRKVKDIRYPNEPDSGSEISAMDDVLSNPPSPPDNSFSSCHAGQGYNCQSAAPTKSAVKSLLPKVAKPAIVAGGTVGVTATKTITCAPGLGDRRASDSRQCWPNFGLEPSPTDPLPPARCELFIESSALSDSSLNELKTFFQKGLDGLKSELGAQINRENAEIKDSIDILSMQISSLPVESENEPEMDLIHSLPMRTIEEIVDFDNYISSNSKYRQFMVQYLKDRSSNILYRCNNKFFTAAVNKTVNDVCSTLMSNEMGTKFCMKGRTSYKISFEASFPRLINLIFDILKAKRGNGPEVEVIVIKKSIGEWFRLARLRGGARAVKSLEAAQGT